MANWADVLKKIATVEADKTAQAIQTDSAFDIVRSEYLKSLSDYTGRNTIAYYSAFLSKPKVEFSQINDADKNGFMLCIHEMDRNKGLDLILHTPGGDVQATISLIAYLRSIFGNNIRAIIPQIAMSAGTMIACSCKEIIMGKQSSIGPIDPQIGMIGVANLQKEVERAYEDIIRKPSSANFWAPILTQLTPSFLEKCNQALEDSNNFLKRALAENMLTDQPQKIESVTKLLANNTGRAHNTHIHYQDCIDTGLNIFQLEKDQELQDLVLTLHHCYMHTLNQTMAIKIIENQMGRRSVIVIQQLMPSRTL